MKQPKHVWLYFGALLLIVGGVVAVSTRHERIPPAENTSGVGETGTLEELPEARAPIVVELKRGDTFDLAAGWVQKKLGNRSYRMLAYNGSIPGPLIKVPQGADVTINFKNDTDMKTLLHSHGVRMDNAFDGSQTTQKEMEPGEIFAYKLKFPDAGMYWYHPHVREDYEQELGLYGNYLVEPSDAKYWNPVNREVALFLDDILIENGKINLSRQGADHTLMGRYGNVMLVNGETNYTLSAQKDEAIRFYITNAANTRPFNFAIQGAKLKLVGADGGAYEKDEWKDSVILGPSERAIIEVLFDKSGPFAMQNKTPDQAYILGFINVSAGPVAVSYAKEFGELKTHNATVQSIAPLRSYFAEAPAKQIRLSVEMSGLPMQMQMGGHMMPASPAGRPGGMMMGGSMMMGASPDGIEWDDANKMTGSMSNTDNVKWKIIDKDTAKENM
ncbi:MAG: multicopper oxidase domain-containing protein, partial [Candidatus Kerfeldbacteria bacterium]|nr:multicopper oxidase domain-containing protein [Candidatus Kerfeldbacteria bacterium]